MKTNQILFALGFLLLTSCTVAPVETPVEKQMAANPVGTRSELNQEKDELLNSAEITPAQKEQLLALRKDTRARMESLNQENLSLELLLYKKVLATEISKKELSGIRVKMNDIAQAKIKVAFDSVQKASAILGKKARLNSNAIHNLMLKEDTQRILQ